MSDKIIPITCPICGAGIGRLKNVAKRERGTKNPLFFFKCPDCNHEFDLRTKHCKNIIADTLAMEEINVDFFRTARGATMLTAEVRI